MQAPRLSLDDRATFHTSRPSTAPDVGRHFPRAPASSQASHLHQHDEPFTIVLDHELARIGTKLLQALKIVIRVPSRLGLAPEVCRDEALQRKYNLVLRRYPHDQPRSSLVRFSQIRFPE